VLSASFLGGAIIHRVCLRGYGLPVRPGALVASFSPPTRSRLRSMMIQVSPPVGTWQLVGGAPPDPRGTRLGPGGAAGGFEPVC